MGGKRSIISLIIVCLIGCMLCGCDKKQDTEKEIGKNAPKIVVGSDNYPPFNYIDENGKPTGIDVDIATEAFKRLGYRGVSVRSARFSSFGSGRHIFSSFPAIYASLSMYPSRV